MILVFAVVAGLGAGLVLGVFWGVRELKVAEHRLEAERGAKDRLLERLGELTASAVAPIQEAVTRTVEATVRTMVAPMGTRMQQAYIPEPEPESPATELYPEWLKDKIAEDNHAVQSEL